MIWYIIGVVVVVGIILFVVFGKKKNKKEEEVEGGQINGSEAEATTIEPTMESETEKDADILPDELSAPIQEKTTDEEKTI